MIILSEMSTVDMISKTPKYQPVDSPVFIMVAVVSLTSEKQRITKLHKSVY